MYWHDDNGPKGYVEMLPIEKRWSRVLDTLFAWHPFYASIILEMERIATDTLPNGAPCPVMATDGRNLYWNPVTVPRLMQEDFIFIVVHEAEHVRLGHHLPLRCAKLTDDKLRQESADDAVNSLLLDVLHVQCSDEMRKFAYLPENHGVPKGLAMEEYYELGKKKEQQQERERSRNENEDNNEDGDASEGSSGDGDGDQRSASDDGQGTGGPDDDDDASTEESGDSDRMDQEGTPGTGQDPVVGDEESSGDNSTPRQDGGQDSGTDGQSGGSGAPSTADDRQKLDRPECLGEVLTAPTDDETTAADVENDWQKTVTRATVAAHEAGKLPGHLREYVEDVLAVKPLPWKSLLKKAIRAMFPMGRTFARPSRRACWRQDVILPADKMDGLDKVEFWTDTSGSMSADDMAMTLPHIARILREFKKASLRVCQFDTRITRDNTYNRRDWKTIEPDEKSFLGRGGTKFAAAIDEINKSKPKLAIILTDGCPCDGWQETRIPIVWLITTDIIAPYGKTIHIRPKER